MDIKFVIALIASALLIIGYIPYFRDTFAKKTKPHLFTWLIWGITQGTATVALLYGGGRFGSVALIIGTLLVLFIFLLSFKYGTKDISKSDRLVLALALIAIIIWWQLKQPLITVFMVSAIDGLGYIPTIRKSFKDPWSETLSFWLIMAIVDCLAIASNGEYNLLTVFYLSVLGVANIIVSSVCIVRRRQKLLKQV
jgi:membrane-associated HD superfamily phosphohydrolase